MKSGTFEVYRVEDGEETYDQDFRLASLHCGSWHPYGWQYVCSMLVKHKLVPDECITVDQEDGDTIAVWADDAEGSDPLLYLRRKKEAT